MDSGEIIASLIAAPPLILALLVALGSVVLAILVLQFAFRVLAREPKK